MNGSYPFYVWSGLLEEKHFKAIGPAIWVFLWCINRTTIEEKNVGKVMYGREVKAETIAEDLGMTIKQVRRHLDILEAKQYIKRMKTYRGQIIEVAKSKRGLERLRVPKNGQSFEGERVTKNGQSDSSRVPKNGNSSPDRVPKNGNSCDGQISDNAMQDKTEEGCKNLPIKHNNIIKHKYIKQSMVQDAKKRTCTNPDVKVFIDWFCVQFQNKTGTKYHITGGKDGDLIKRLLKTHSLVDLQRAAGLMFSDTWIAEHRGYSIGILSSQINGLLTRGKKDKDDWKKKLEGV